MTTSAINMIKQIKALQPEEREAILSGLLQDSELREDILDLALVLQAEAEGGEPVSIDDYLAGKRTYE
ncbi:MAG: hypothetical protein HQ568_05455 [Calditrichaeota bacterium]|nr:hypothetical protein [Calditrichota bacterium]